MPLPAHQRQAREIPVRSFSTNLIWPLRLSAHGGLYCTRKSNDACASHFIRDCVTLLKDHKPHPWEPIDYLQTDGCQSPAPSHDRYSEFLYFHPFIQSCFYGKQGPVAILRQPHIRGARIRLRPGDTTWEFNVPRVLLFLFPTDVAIAVVELASPQAWNAAGMTSPEREPAQFTLADAMDTLDWARRIYPPYFMSDGALKLSPGGVPDLMEWVLDSPGSFPAHVSSNFNDASAFVDPVLKTRTTPVATHWQHLLMPLLPEQPAALAGESEADRGKGPSSLRYAQVEDDRIPVWAYIAVDDPTQISRWDWIRLAVCDAAPDDSAKPPYGRRFLKQDSQMYYYDRFWDPKAGFTTRYLITGYSLLAVGRKEDWFFCNLVRMHMHQHYFMLGIIAHMQKASLLVFWRRLGEMIHTFEAAPANPQSRLELFNSQKWLLSDLMDFVSRFYFLEVSNQLQAMEMYDLISNKLRIGATFTEVKEQSEFVGKVLFENWQEETSAYQTKLATLAQRWVPPAFAAALLGTNFGLNQIDIDARAWLQVMAPFKYLTATQVAMFLWAITFLVTWAALYAITKATIAGFTTQKKQS